MSDNYFITVDDVKALWRSLTDEESERTQKLIPIIADSLRQEARKVGSNLDHMIMSGDLMPNVLKSVMVDVVARTLMTPTDQPPMTQMSQTALGYTTQGTFLVPGGGLFIKDSELRRLGLKRQRLRGVDLYGEPDQRDYSPADCQRTDWN